jgi:dihydroorotase
MKMWLWLVLLAAPAALAQPSYDLLLRGGHVIDPRNNISGIRDVAIQDRRIAEVAERIDPARARQVADATGLYVTPGLIDIHAHVYTGTGERGSYAGDNSVYPDGFMLRVGVTTVVDAGGAGWRNFPDFLDRVIRRSRTRVLAFLNIVGAGMRGGKYEQDPQDMLAEPAARMAQQHPGLIVGIKTAHYGGPEWVAVERSVEAGRLSNLPVMVDYGINYPNHRPLRDLLLTKLRPGDIYTHMYSGLRNELGEDGKVNPAFWEARKRGVIFDVGHGGGSFFWRIAVPAWQQGLKPDVISTDLHIGSMNAGMKDMLNVMSKFLNLEASLEEVIRWSTWNPATYISQTELGHLTKGAPADVAVLRLEKGDFGFVDSGGARRKGDRKLTCELTIRDGAVLYDLNGISKADWNATNPGR